MDELIARLLRRRDELEELLVYRRTVEPAVSRLAAETRRRSDLATMRRAIRGMAEAPTEPEYMRCDTEFHLAIAGATQNRYLHREIEEIRMQLNDALSLLPESETWHRRLSGEHEAILGAIEARDPDTAEAATELHVENSDRSVRAVVAAIRRRRG
jgi:DNA-binding FadR family transcriptional regulator